MTILQESFGLAHSFVSTMVTSLLQNESPGTILSVDIGGSFFDSVARTAAKSGGHKLTRSPSLLRYRSEHSYREQTRSPPETLAEKPVFGKVDGALRISSDDTVERFGSVAELATRSVDSWRRSRSKLLLLHLGDTELLEDQISGTVETLERDRPIVTLYPNGKDKAALLSRFREFHYAAIDLDGQPVITDKTSHLLDLGWVLLPDEKCNDALSAVPLMPNGRLADVAFAAGREIVERNLSARQRHYRDLFSLPIAEQPLLARKIDIREIISDCYSLETDGEHAWRWLGPRASSKLVVPCTWPGAYRFEITILASFLKSGLEECRVFFEGIEVNTLVNGTTEGTIEFLGIVEPSEYAGYAVVDLICPGSRLPSDDDRRELRMSVESVGMSPAP